jgi:hypothetical protein
VRIATTLLCAAALLSLAACGTEDGGAPNVTPDATGMDITSHEDGGPALGDGTSAPNDPVDSSPPEDTTTPVQGDASDGSESNADTTTPAPSDGDSGAEAEGDTASASVDGAGVTPATECVDDADCPVDNCLTGSCDGGICVLSPGETPCDDGNPCTSPDTCDQGACVPGPSQCSEVCDNGLDDDLDGAVDCLDDDCLVSATCWQTCHGQELLACGQQIFDTTAKVSASALLQGGCGLQGDGKEVIYRFVPPPDVLSATVTLEGSGFVGRYAPGALGACDGASCMDADISEWTWTQDDVTEEIYIVVDGPVGDEGPFALTLICSFPLFESCSNGVDDDLDGEADCDDTDCVDHPVCGAPIEDCSNGLDDDLDGETDCDDTNCEASFACSPSPGCDPLYDLPCGTVLEESIGGIGATNFIDLWAGINAVLDGPETAHRLLFTVDTQVALTLTGAPAGAHLILVPNAESCAATNATAYDTELIVFVAEAGVSYAAVIDVPSGVEGTYTLDVECATPELCDNGFDDDQDALVDCQDDDCFAVGPCIGQLCQGADSLSCGQSFGAVLPPSGVLEQSSCGPTGPGGELIAIFTADIYTEAVFTVEGEGSPSLFALDASGICDTGLCLGGGGQLISATLEAGTSLYILMDSEAGGALQVTTNCGGAEVACWDGVDDDGDGETDCEDSDCLGADGCAPSCPDLGVVTCGSFPLASAEVALSLIDGWGCPDATQLTGAEAGWRLDLSGELGAEVPVRVTVHDPEDTGASLLVIAPGVTCDPMACTAAPGGTWEATLSPQSTPYLVVDRPAGDQADTTLGITVNCYDHENSCVDGVDGDGDGWQDCADPDCIGQIASCDEAELACYNGLDDDGDQMVDCEDEDCAFAANCYVEDPGCIQGGDVFCNAPVQVSTHDVAAKPGPLKFACPSESVEAIHGSFGSFYMGKGEPVTVSMTDVDGSAHVVVVESPDGIACDPTACVASGASPFAFEAEAGQIYLILLISTDNQTAEATLTMACEVLEPDCFDDIDDDGDGLTDCDDPACAALQQCQVCLPVPELLCDTTTDITDNLSWTTDAVDDGCGGTSLGPEVSYRWTAEVNTVLTLTTDADGAVIHVYEDAEQPCQLDSCVTGGTSPLTFLADEGAIYHVVVDRDEGSPTGTLTAACLALTESCANGMDDDNDGATDCEDILDCKLFPGCPMLEVCDDAVDNDGDGYSDCKDIGCVGHIACPDAEVCDDTLDNDGDGFTDCDDTLCVAAANCAAEGE